MLGSDLVCLKTNVTLGGASAGCGGGEGGGRGHDKGRMHGNSREREVKTDNEYY